MNEALTFLHEYCDFSDPNCVWVMKGIARSKDNVGVEMPKFIHRMIVAKPEDIDRCYAQIHTLAVNPDIKYRIYISLNSRDVVDAAFKFQKKLVDITQGLAKGHADALQMAKKVGSMWKTALEQNFARGTKRFLFDLDENDELMAAAVCGYLENMKRSEQGRLGTSATKLHTCRKTVNGYAIVFDACDTRGLMTFCKEQGIPTDKNTLQKDSMLFIEQF
jgi:hypothetical protein